MNIEEMPGKIERALFYAKEAAYYYTHRAANKREILGGPLPEKWKNSVYDIVATSLWRKRFYQDAEKAASGTDKQCYEHTLKKYLGARPEILKLYRMKAGHLTVRAIAGFDIAHSAAFYFGTFTCSLCIKYMDEDDGCGLCPLYSSQGHKECGEEGTPFADFGSQNPEPMIQAMELLIEIEDLKEEQNS